VISYARRLAITIAFCLPVAVPAAQAPQALAGPPIRVALLSPSPTTFVSGPTTLRASVEPATDVATVTFFVDGRQVCQLGAAPFECEWDAGRDVIAHQIRAVIALQNGSRVVRTMRTRGLQYADKVDVDAVQVTVTVTDNRGKFVPGIPQASFRVYEDGKEQPLGYFASQDVPLELIVAVDISGSMAAAMPRLKRAVKSFLGAVPDHNQVTLLGFNDSVFTLTRKTTDPSERVRAVDRLAPWGATALYDVIIRGIDMLGRQTGRRSLVVFTDGEDQGSHVTIEDVERRLQASDVTLYMIGQGRGVTHDYLRKVMQRLTVPTGGRAFTTDNIDALEGAFEDLLEELSNQYLIGYQPTFTVRDDTWHEIKVEIESQQELNIRARQGYRAVAQR
jgi:VWFA-related protein